MSSTLAIAAVTAVINNLLTNRLSRVYGALGESTPDVSALPPDMVAALNRDVLNLFLYQLTPNLGWHNVDYPARDTRGNRVSYPPLALDLQYLLIAHSEVAYRAEIMLASAMQVLHEVGILPRELIEEAISSFSPSTPEGILLSSTLAEQIETIKITPMGLNTEEMSKLWGAFQTNYRPTVAYYISVVLIESEPPARSPLPVKESRLFVMPFKRPVINAVEPQIVAPGETLRIKGYNLKAEELRVQFSGDLEINPNPENTTEREIAIEPPLDLAAGVKTLQILHYVNYEPDATNPPDFRAGFESNIFPFIWRPQITAIPTEIALGTSGATLNISVASPVGERQRVTLLLGDRAISNVTINSTVPTDLEFEIPADFPTGRYLVRIRIDGAESLLQQEDSSYNAPAIDIIP